MGKKVVKKFDNVFTIWEERSPWNKPLRIRHKSEEGKKTIYLFVNFQCGPIRRSDNKEVYETLKNLVGKW